MDLSINTSIYGMFLILSLSYYLLDCLNFNIVLGTLGNDAGIKGAAALID